MSALFSLILLPLALPFRLAAAQPWPTIIASGVLAAGAYWIGQDLVSFVLVTYMAYVMIWLAETSRPSAVEEAAAAAE
jgi:hypothetical protein